jgi:hypothetical protein
MVTRSHATLKDERVKHPRSKHSFKRKRLLKPDKTRRKYLQFACLAGDERNKSNLDEILPLETFFSLG